jgi:hypothetical protein
MSTQSLATLVMFIVFGMLAIWAIYYQIHEYFDYKLREELFTFGRIVKCFSYKNVSHDDCDLDTTFIIVGVLNNEVKVKYKSGKKTYKMLNEIGVMSDIIEIYEPDGVLVGRYKHYESNVLFSNFLKKID